MIARTPAPAPDLHHIRQWQCFYHDDDPTWHLQHLLDQYDGQADALGQTNARVQCPPPARTPCQAHLTLVAAPRQDVRFNCILALLPGQEEHQLFSMYPECDGRKVPVQLTHVYEWPNRCEATLQGRLEQGEHQTISFFDTRYALHSQNYTTGKTYTFNMAAISEDVTRREMTQITIEGQAAARLYHKLGASPEYQEDGTVTPFVIPTGHMVTLNQQQETAPYVGDFQSPLLEAPQTVQTFDDPFTRLIISLNPSLEGPANPIPLYVRTDSVDFLDLQPGDALMGKLCLMGYWDP